MPSDRAALWTLRLALTAMCLGIAWHRTIDFDAVSSLLYVDLGWCSEELANGLSAVGAGLFALAGVALLLPARFARPAALWVAAWTLVLLACSMARDPQWPEVEPGAWAVRWLGPLALWIWLGRRALGETGPGRAELLLRVAAAATFLFHGMEAAGVRFLEASFSAPKGEFVDFLFTAERTVFGSALTQTQNEALLRAVGALDATVAILLLCGRFVPVALWMAAWGFLTAGLRILEYEETGPAKFLTRAPNGGVPLCLALCWWRARRAATPNRP